MIDALPPFVAALLMLIGAAMVLISTRYVVAAVRASDPQRALWIMRGFRIAVVGLACAGLGAGWWWEISGLVGLSLIIGGEELLESTVVIQALKDGLRRRSAFKPPLMNTDDHGGTLSLLFSPKN